MHDCIHMNLDLLLPPLCKERYLSSPLHLLVALSLSLSLCVSSSASSCSYNMLAVCPLMLSRREDMRLMWWCIRPKTNNSFNACHSMTVSLSARWMLPYHTVLSPGRGRSESNHVSDISSLFLLTHMLLQEIKLVVDHLEMNLSAAVRISSCMHCVKWLLFCSSSLTDSAGKQRLLIIYTRKRNPWSYCNNSYIHPSCLGAAPSTFSFPPSLYFTHSLGTCHVLYSHSSQHLLCARLTKRIV